MDLQKSVGELSLSSQNSAKALTVRVLFLLCWLSSKMTTSMGLFFSAGLSDQTRVQELSDQHERETSEFLSEIQALQHELSSLSTSALAKENERMRKDLEKTKSKLRDTESKLRNAVQEKTKLEVMCPEFLDLMLHLTCNYTNFSRYFPSVG